MTGRRFVEEALLRRRIAVCVGCGGVGKTTVSAALALEAARNGRRALVLTIDPARRLADALGVRALGNQPQALPREVLTALGVPPEGHLSAMMLDMKRTFDDLVERFAESEEARERILQNNIYQHVSDALAGSVEYSAMEKVYELFESGAFDLIVVDTPPAQHALDFMEAPQRLVQFLDSRIVQVLIHPAMAAGRFGFRIFQRGTRRVLHIIERVSGIGFIEDISEFLLAFEGMSEGFRERAGRVRATLEGPEASFVLIAGPEGESVQQAVRFADRMREFRVHLSGVLVNRVRKWPGDGAPDLEEVDDADVAALAEALAASEEPGFPSDTAARAALDAAKGYAALVQRDSRALSELRARIQGTGQYWAEIPELDVDVHDLEGLRRIGRHVFGEDGPGKPAGEPLGAAESRTADPAQG